MNIVILHCHFERGGVTQVVENHVRWLRNCDGVRRIVLVSGTRRSGLSTATAEATEQIVIEDFDYDAGEVPRDVEARVNRMVQGLSSAFSEFGLSAEDSVLHWHNHSLGKNTAAPGAIHQLAATGFKILLQIHDFAEDNRPDNYARLVEARDADDKAAVDRYLYPVCSQIHYATLTRADAAILAQVGVPEEQTHCLPNSVVAASDQPVGQQEALDKVRQAMQLPSDARWCVYPVRGIRRKNVGEFLLLSRWTDPDQYAGITLCPATPLEYRSYARWQQLAGEVAPRAVFDAGHDPSISLMDNLVASEAILSTSVAEGFGMAFLEPWLVGREVVARRLATVTDDFRQVGVQLDKLYEEIPIPGESSWIQQCHRETSQAMSIAWESLPSRFRPSIDSPKVTKRDWIDFASLIPGRQAEVLGRLARDSGFESDVKQRSRALVAFLTTPADEAVVDVNRQAVQREYSPQRTGGKLTSIYELLCDAVPDSEVRAPTGIGAAVDLIAQARPFYPCRTEVIDE